MKIYKTNSTKQNDSELRYNNITQNELICLYALQLALLKNDETGNLEFFTLMNNEEGICITKNNESWEIYTLEKGNKYDKKIYDNCILTCIEVIGLLAKNQKEAKEILYDFSSYLQQNYTREQLEIMMQQNLYITTEEERNNIKNNPLYHDRYYNLLKTKVRI